MGVTYGSLVGITLEGSLVADIRVAYFALGGAANLGTPIRKTITVLCGYLFAVEMVETRNLGFLTEYCELRKHFSPRALA